MSPLKFRGIGVALITPFHEDKTIDYPALGRIIEFIITGGVDYLVCLGTTGEAITLSAQECREVLDFTIKVTANRVPVVAGFFGSNHTARLVEELKSYDFQGVSAIMSSSPSYNKPNQEGIYQHYMAVAEASPLPLIIYNVPGRTASNVSADTLLRLANSSSKFIGVKEASGDLVQAMQILKRRPEGFLVISGDDPLTLPILGCGGDGVISVIGNAYPAQFSEMVHAGLRGDFETARSLNDALLDVHPWLYTEGNPAGIKAALEILGFCTRQVRLPLVALSEATKEKLQQEMHQVAAASPRVPV
ncbi:MAG: 4-hydroxy-tetrahydrodipicolinate synthase [Saprospiraceae bacterium]|nr:4-hydroxy-tetrahydrodipicolinate synthase [Saprospiraceae bacterium]